MLSQDPVRTPLPYWDGKKWSIGTQQFVYSYAPSIHFVISQAKNPLFVLFNNRNISMSAQSVQIYDYNQTLLWNSANVSDININNTVILPAAVTGPLDWKFYSESFQSNVSLIKAVNPLEQLNLTNDETIYLWYRRNISLAHPSLQSTVQVQTRRANSLLFFLGGQFLGKFDNGEHGHGPITATVSLNLSQFLPNRTYLFEILSISLGIDNYNIGPGHFEYKGIVGDVSLDGQSLIGNETNRWEHQKGLVGEVYQVYTEQGSKAVEWSSNWTMAINKSVTWFQTHFDLDHLAREDLNANPILLDVLGLNRGHAFINGNDLGLYWLIEGSCHDPPPCCCIQAQTNCWQPTQRYYHIPSDWLTTKNNVLTVFEDSGAPSPGSVGLVQRINTLYES